MAFLDEGPLILVVEFHRTVKDVQILVIAGYRQRIVGTNVNQRGRSGTQSKRLGSTTVVEDDPTLIYQCRLRSGNLKLGGALYKQAWGNASGY